MLTTEQIKELRKLPVPERRRMINESITDAWAARWLKLGVDRFKEAWGYDPTAIAADPNFSVKEAYAQLREQHKSRNISEAITSSQVAALTSNMVLQQIIGAYQLVDVAYKGLARMLTSTRSEESWYPLQGSDAPVQVGDNEEAPETRTGGIQSRIKNYRFARMLVISKTAFDDDQTGELRQLATGFGGNMAYSEERFWLQQLFNTYTVANVQGGTGSNPIVPPMCIAGQAVNGTAYNGLTYGGPTCSVGDITQANVENLFEAAPYVANVLGEYTLSDPNAILAASSRKLTLKKLLNSFFNPAVPGSAGTTGSYFSENVLKGELAIFTTRFLAQVGTGLDSSNPPWGIGEAGGIGSFQNRTPLEVLQESPLAGKSFDEQSVRTLVQRRFGAGVTVPESFLRGN